MRILLTAMEGLSELRTGSDVSEAFPDGTLSQRTSFELGHKLLVVL